MDAVEQVIRAAEERAAALAAGDENCLRGLLHELFRWTTHVGETFTRSEYISRNTGGSTVWRSQALTGTDVTVVGETAVLYTQVVDEVVAADGATETFRVPVTQVWVRSRGRWLCLAGHAGPRRK